MQKEIVFRINVPDSEEIGKIIAKGIDNLFTEMEKQLAELRKSLPESIKVEIKEVPLAEEKPKE